MFLYILQWHFAAHYSFIQRVSNQTFVLEGSQHTAIVLHLGEQHFVGKEVGVGGTGQGQQFLLDLPVVLGFSQAFGGRGQLGGVGRVAVKHWKWGQGQQVCVEVGTGQGSERGFGAF